MTTNVIDSPVITKNKSSSSNPTQMRAILSAGTKFDMGPGKGRERKAAETTIAKPQIKWLALELVQGCEYREII